MKGLKITIAIIGVLITLPISIYIQYKVLQKIDATELMWFLFYVNIPLIFLIQVISKLTEK